MWPIGLTPNLNLTRPKYNPTWSSLTRLFWHVYLGSSCYFDVIKVHMHGKVKQMILILSLLFGSYQIFELIQLKININRLEFFEFEVSMIIQQYYIKPEKCHMTIL